MKIRRYLLTGLLLLVAGLTAVQAATVRIPTDQATFAAAFTAAAPGDTIRFMDSASYDVTSVFTLNKAVTIDAAVGANPTLNDAGPATNLAMFNVSGPAVTGLHFGSNNGGRIMIRSTRCGFVRYVSLTASDVVNLTFENLDINCTGTGYTGAIVTSAPGAPASVSTFRNVKLYYQPSVTGYMVTLTGGNNGQTYRFEQCELIHVSAAGLAFFLQNSASNAANVILDSCVVKSNGTCITWGYGAASTAQVNLIIRDSWIESTSTAAKTIRIVGDFNGGVFELSRSLVKGGLYPVSFDGTAVTNFTAAFDHNDLVAGSTSTYCLVVASGTAGTLGVSNCNVFNQNADGSGTLVINPATPTATVTSDHNNYYVTTAAVKGMSLGVGDIDAPGLAPAYPDLAGGDLKYLTHSTLLTADAAGHEIGSYASFKHTLTYTAGTGGSITGTATQTLNFGADGTAVTAVADTGYQFDQWSDGSTVNPRTDLFITTDTAVTASFTELGALSSNKTSLRFLEGGPGAVDVVNGGEPTTKSLTLTNTGELPVSFTGGATETPGLEITGTNAADFAIESVTPATSSPLAAGESVTVVVRFAPQETERTLGLTATLVVTSDSTVTPTLNISLQGDAVPVEMSSFSAE